MTTSTQEPQYRGQVDEEVKDKKAEEEENEDEDKDKDEEEEEEVDRRDEPSKKDEGS